MVAMLRISFRRSLADWPIVLAAGVICLLAATLLAAGSIYAGAVSTAGLHRDLADSPAREANIEDAVRGEQQRVAIARALANRPDVVLADEPTGQLDSGTGRSIMGLLRAIVRSEGLTAVIATHDPMLIDLADRTVELRDGRVVDGTD